MSATFFLWFTGSELDSYTTEQLGMCEKSDLVDYILSLKDNILERQDCLTDLEEEVERLQAWEENNLIHKDSVKPVKPVTRSDTRIKQLEEEVDKLQLQSRLYDECVVKGMKNHIKKLNDECGGLKERLIDMSFKVDELESQIELTDECVIDGLKQGHKDLQEEIDRLQEEKDKAWQEGYDEGELEHSVDKEYLDEKDDEIKKLKQDHSMNTQYWNCYIRYADPKADRLPEKDFIDEWCESGDVVDEKLKEYLYDSFCIDEDEEE